MVDRELTLKSDLIEQIHDGWQELQEFVDGLTVEQLNGPMDSAGWTIKDHLMHLAVWESGILALINRENRSAFMGIDDDIWDSGDYDEINEVIHQRYQDKSVDEVLLSLRIVHESLLHRLATLSDDDLSQSYQHFQPHKERASLDPVYEWIAGNTYEHYAEHIPWMIAITMGT